MLNQHITIAKDNAGTRILARWLKSCGASVDLLAMTGHQTLEAVAGKKDGLLIVWGGALRRNSNDQWKPDPQVIFAEQGFIPHYSSMMLDAIGCGFRSFLATNKLDYSTTPSYQGGVAGFLAEQYFGHIPPAPAIAMPKPPYILLPLQHLNDTVMKFDAPAYARDYPALIESLLKCLPEGATLVVKQHPKVSQRLEIDRKTPQLCLIDQVFDEGTNHAFNRWLLERSSHLVTVNSSFAFEAMAHRVPVITLGLGVFNLKNVTLEVSGISREMFDLAQHKEPEVTRFLADLVFNRQILFAGQSAEHMRRVWETMMAEHRQYWGS